MNGSPGKIGLLLLKERTMVAGQLSLCNVEGAMHVMNGGRAKGIGEKKLSTTITKWNGF